MTEGRCGELGSQPRTEPAVWPGNGDQPPGPALLTCRASSFRAARGRAVEGSKGSGARPWAPQDSHRQWPGQSRDDPREHLSPCRPALMAPRGPGLSRLGSLQPPASNFAF